MAIHFAVTHSAYGTPDVLLFTDYHQALECYRTMPKSADPGFWLRAPSTTGHVWHPIGAPQDMPTQNPSSRT